MRTTILAALLGLAATSHAFGNGVSCAAANRKAIRAIKFLPRAWTALTFCASLTFDGSDLVWVETAFASNRRGTVLCFSTAVLERDRLTIRRLEQDGCGVYKGRP